MKALASTFSFASLRDWLLLAALVIVACCLPLFTSNGVILHFATMTLYAALLSVAWNVLAGFAGQFSFGHAAFFGTGAYVMAVLQVKLSMNPWLALPLALAAGGLVGAVIGGLAFRYGLKGSYFALVTLAFAEVLRILSNTFEFTGAGVGIQLPLKEGFAYLQFDKDNALRFIALLLGAAIAVTLWLRASRLGAWMLAVRDNEAAASAVGVPAFRVKWTAAVISGVMTAAAGVFYVQHLHYIDPGIAYGASVSVEALVGAIVGGIGSVWGPVLGALVLHLLGELTRNLFGDLPGISLVVYGVVLVLMVTLAPRGLVGILAALRQKLAQPRQTEA